ncbi:tetratricopeptide repeat protein [Actinomadura violacea]|uniref:Tetratricopeptide repeat protein n=1 Tax=Actinomadura violacea TaxID=2819934 RepID=A0ABS3RHQ7_9ACTN|nr:tetratricopeptide repeat protein [Actinomadura violacea]MBO2456247.1 tetratricopeptide repeat protein [Actinomadura violacea]
MADDQHGDANRFEGHARNVVQAQRVEVMNVYGAHEDPPDPPYALPPPPSRFQDRAPLLRLASEAASADRPGGEPAVIIVAGLRGVGKTAMAVHWAGLERERFPDGLLYADLGGGLSRRGLGGGLGETATSLLEQLGVSGEHLPRSDQGRLALLRTRLARRKVFLLLDNARLPGEVERLLPPSPGSVVFVTTDGALSEVGDLAGRHGAEVILLRELSERDGLALLRALVGDETVDRDVEGARALLRVCGGWPLAIRLAAGRLKVRRGTRLADLAARLEAARDGTGGGPRPAPHGEWTVHVLGDEVYAEMPDELRRAYRLLSLHPRGGDRPTPVPGGERGPALRFGTGAAAALLGVPEPDAADLLDALVDRHVLDEDAGRYLFPDLIRAHARNLADGEDEAGAAVRRVSDWYLRAAVQADLAVNAHRPTSGPVFRELRGAPSPYGTGRAAVSAALAWLSAEHRNLCAVVQHAGDRGWHGLVWQLCEALWGFYFSLKHYDQWIETHRIGLRAAEELGDPAARFRMGVQLGRALYETRRFREAHEVLERTLEITADPLDRATVLEFIGRAHQDAGDPERALDYLRQSCDLEERHDRPRGVAIKLHHIGRARHALGDAAEALRCLRRAQSLFAAVPDPYNEARVRATLGALHLAAGRFAEAAADLDAALETMRAEGRTFQTAEITEALAELAAATGDAGRAAELRRAAAAAYDAVGSLKGEELRNPPS